MFCFGLLLPPFAALLRANLSKYGVRRGCGGWGGEGRGGDGWQLKKGLCRKKRETLSENWSFHLAGNPETRRKCQESTKKLWDSKENFKNLTGMSAKKSRGYFKYPGELKFRHKYKVYYSTAILRLVNRVGGICYTLLLNLPLLYRHALKRSHLDIRLSNYIQ